MSCKVDSEWNLRPVWIHQIRPDPVALMALLPPCIETLEGTRKTDISQF
jgi:hypothetical protein